MKYFLVRSFNPEVSFDNLVLEIDDPNNNSWLINYGINLDNNKNYFNLKFYGEENLLKEQSMLNIRNVFIFNCKLRDYIKNTIDCENIEWLDFDLYNSNSKKVSHDFKIMNFKTTVNCLNWDSSKFDVSDEDEKRYVFYSIKVTNEINKHSIGCIDSHKGLFVNENIKTKIEKKEFKGLAFKELIIE